MPRELFRNLPGYLTACPRLPGFTECTSMALGFLDQLRGTEGYGRNGDTSHSQSPDWHRHRHHCGVLPGDLCHWLLLRPQGTHLNRVLSRRPRRRMVCHWGVAVRFEYFHRALHRPGRVRRQFRTGRGVFRMAGLSDSAGAGLGFRSLLSALQRFHHAGISGAALQPRFRGLSGQHFHHRLCADQDFGTSLGGGHRPQGSRGLESARSRADSRGRHRHLHHRRRTVGGDLYRGGADPGSFDGCDRAYVDRHAPGGRIRRSARRPARQLFSHGEADERSRLPLDWNLLRRADSGHLVLVYRPGNCAARAFGAG